MLLIIFYMYAVLSIVIGAGIAITIFIERIQSNRSVVYSPDKDSLGYLIAFIIGCPIVNIVAMILYMILYMIYRRKE